MPVNNPLIPINKHFCYFCNLTLSSDVTTWDSSCEHIKDAIKRAENQACLCYPEHEQARRSQCKINGRLMAINVRKESEEDINAH